MKPTRTELCIVSAVVVAALISWHVASLRKRQDIAYQAYRMAIGCHQADAIHAFGKLPPRMAMPKPWTLDRCYGKTMGYEGSEIDDYYREDQKQFRQALSDSGW